MNKFAKLSILGSLGIAYLASACSGQNAGKSQSELELQVTQLPCNSYTIESTFKMLDPAIKGVQYKKGPFRVFPKDEDLCNLYVTRDLEGEIKKVTAGYAGNAAVNAHPIK
jgi:hypothetical protein